MEFYSENSNVNTDNIKPCYKKIYELEKHLLINYNAELIEEVDERMLKFVKYNIVNDKLPLLFQETIGADLAEYKGEDALLMDIDTKSERFIKYVTTKEHFKKYLYYYEN